MSIVEYLQFYIKIKIFFIYYKMVKKSKKWYNVPFNKSALVVNTGRALEYLSKGKFKATNHNSLE